MLYKRTSLSNLADYINGMAFKPSDWKDEGVKIIRIEQLNNPKGDYDYFQGYFPESNAIDNEDLIFSWSATLKVVIWKYGKGVLNQHLFKVIPYTNTDKYFLHQLLDYHMDKLAESSHGSTMKHIKREELDKYKVEVPANKQEQSKIADILSTCDEVIEKAEETIEKYKQIKAGMMQDLFTRGLDENGKLRPTYAQASDLYKYSKELDRHIPKEWDVTTLLDCCTKPCSYGINAPAVDFDTNLPLYLRITDITEEGKYNQQGRKCVDSIDASKYILEPNDIVFARTGATVGKTYLYDIDDGQLVYAGFLICFSLDPSIVDPYFIKTYTETDYYLNWVTVYSQRSGQPGINGNEYSKMLLAKPQRKEQEKIGIVFKKIDEKIIYENEYLNKYKQIKQGLMKRLLTPPADAEIVEE